MFKVKGSTRCKRQWSFLVLQPYFDPNIIFFIMLDQSIFFNFKNSLLLVNKILINKEPHNSLHNKVVSLDLNPN